VVCGKYFVSEHIIELASAKALSYLPLPLVAVQPEEMDARLLSALITGIRRAFPYVDQNVSGWA
jgi:hypothetical protein